MSFTFETEFPDRVRIRDGLPRNQDADISGGIKA